MKKRHDSKDVTRSRKEALQKAISLIEEGGFEEKFGDKNGSYYSKDKFIVTWLSNKKGYAGETSLDLTDNCYSDYSGYKCVLCNRGLFHENQIKGFGSIERGLLGVIMRLAPNKKKRQELFDRYCEPWNKRNNTKA